MVNKHETIYFIISISDKRLSSFLISLILSLFFFTYILFFPYLFRFNFVVSERNVHILFRRHIWTELSLLFWTFLGGTFFSRWWGWGWGWGGAHAPIALPPSVRACEPYNWWWCGSPYWQFRVLKNFQSRNKFSVNWLVLSVIKRFSALLGRCEMSELSIVHITDWGIFWSYMSEHFAGSKRSFHNRALGIRIIDWSGHSERFDCKCSLRATD